MRQLIALAILVGLCVGGWMFRHQIKAMIVSHAEGDGKTDAPPEPAAPVVPGSTPSGGSSTTPGATTPGISLPGPVVPIPGKTEAPTSTLSGENAPGKVQPINVTLELLVVPNEQGGGFTIEGKTNLLPATEMQLALTASRSGVVERVSVRVDAGSPKNTFTAGNLQLPDTQYQIDVLMHAGRQTDFGLSKLYSQPQMLRGPLVFPKSPEGLIVRATGVLRKTAKPKAAISVALKGGLAK